MSLVQEKKIKIPPTLVVYENGAETQRYEGPFAIQNFLKK